MKSKTGLVKFLEVTREIINSNILTGLFKLIVKICSIKQLRRGAAQEAGSNPRCFGALGDQRNQQEAADEAAEVGRGGRPGAGGGSHPEVGRRHNSLGSRTSGNAWRSVQAQHVP